jgi:tRNA G18 (ribose-2'-O)-methylase SpoU
MSEQTQDPRNVVDEFKDVAVADIRLRMQPRRTQLVNVCVNLTSDFNKSSIIRAGEAHAAREFVFLNKVNDQDPTNPEGVKRYDRRGTVGAHHYANITHHVYTAWPQVLADYRAQGYTVFAVDNTLGYDPTPIYDVALPEKSLFLYGEEGPGLPTELVAASDHLIYIPQFGVPRSINVAQAAAICMYEYARQHRPVL